MPDSLRPWVVLCIVAASFGLAWRLAGYPLLEPDEGRNAEVAREMAATNGYVLPTLNGLPYVDKPVVFYAADAAAIELLGPTALAARLPPLLFTLATLVLVLWYGRRQFGRDGGWIALIATAASPFTIAYARTVIMDSATTLFVVAALITFYEAIESDGEWWSVAAWVAVGLGVLTKGPVALALPLFVTVPYAIWRHRVRRVFDLTGILAFLAVVLPWVIAMTRRVPDYLHYVVAVETADRLRSGGLGRSGPIWYFFPILFGAVFPWSAAVLGGWRRALVRVENAVDRRTVFLLLWIVVPLLFFTLAQSKRPQYILPIVPALGLLLARAWGNRAGVLTGVVPAGAALALLGAVFLVGSRLIVRLVPASPPVAAAIPRAALLLGIVALLGGVSAIALRRRLGPVLLALTLPVAAVPVAGVPLLRAIGRERSSAGLAQALAPSLGASTEIVAVGTYPLSLPFYLRRELTLSTATGRELTSNYIPRHLAELRTASNGRLQPAGWWRDAAVICRRPRIFIVSVNNTEARQELSRLPLIAETGRVAAYGPCGANHDLAVGP